MIKNREFCNICGKKLDHITFCDDPCFYVYKCDDCGYYVILYETQTGESLDIPVIDKCKLDEYKKSHNDINYDRTIFLIGNNKQINSSKNNNFEKHLKHGKFNFDKVIYLNRNED